MDKKWKVAFDILKRIESCGAKAYIVGGAVRDHLMGIESHDLDIATNLSINEIEKMWPSHDIGQSRDFGIVVIEQDGYTFEAAHFRTETYSDSGRWPSEVKKVSTLKEDVARRDFTVNSLAMDSKGKIIDFFGGQEDIENKIIRAVGNAEERFQEDFLRMMRGVRFAAKLGFEIEPGTEKAIKNLAGNITSLSVERIKEEIFKTANESGEKFAGYIQLMDKMGLLKYTLSEVEKQKYFKHDIERHPEGKNVFEHVMAALKTIEAGHPMEMMATLLHDVGKIRTYSEGEDGRAHYYGHAHEGAKMVGGIADRLKMSNREKEALVFSTEEHMKLHHALNMRPSKVVGLMVNRNWGVLRAVAKADEMARGIIPSRKFEEFIDGLEEIKRKWETPEKKLKVVDGHHVMELLGIEPGPMVGKAIREVTEWVIDNDIDPDDRAGIDSFIIDLSKRR